MIFRKTTWTFHSSTTQRNININIKALQRPQTSPHLTTICDNATNFVNKHITVLWNLIGLTTNCYYLRNVNEQSTSSYFEHFVSRLYFYKNIHAHAQTHSLTHTNIHRLALLTCVACMCILLIVYILCGISKMSEFINFTFYA